MSNKQIETIVENMIALFISTIQKQPENKGKISVEEIMSTVNSEDLQSEMKKVISEGIPKKARTSSLKEKKLKDENAPKRPKTAYMFFSEKKRPEIREEQPELKMTEISKVIGQLWKEVTPEGRAKYIKKASEDKERYTEEMKDYIRPSDEVLLEQKVNQKKKRGKPSSGGKKRSKKPEGAPKGTKTAYMFFCAAKRDEVKEAFPDYKMTEVSKELGRMWREDFPGDEDREEFVKQAAEDKERYAQEKAEWDIKHGADESESPKPTKKTTQARGKTTQKSGKAASKKPAKAAASSSDDSDDEPEKSTQERGKTTPPRGKAASKKPAKAAASSSDDSDDEPEKSTQERGKATTGAKKSAKAAASSSDDSDDEPENSAQERGKAATGSKKPVAKPSTKKIVQIPKFVGADDETSSDDE